MSNFYVFNSLRVATYNEIKKYSNEYFSSFHFSFYHFLYTKLKSEFSQVMTPFCYKDTLKTVGVRQQKILKTFLRQATLMKIW